MLGIIKVTLQTNTWITMFYKLKAATHSFTHIFLGGGMGRMKEITRFKSWFEIIFAINFLPCVKIKQKLIVLS